MNDTLNSYIACNWSNVEDISIQIYLVLFCCNQDVLSDLGCMPADLTVHPPPLKAIESGLIFWAQVTIGA